MREIPSAFFSDGLMAKPPVAQTMTRPKRVPRCFPAGTTALTRSPVRNPRTVRNTLGPVRGNPNRFIRHIWLEPCPVDLSIKARVKGSVQRNNYFVEIVNTAPLAKPPASEWLQPAPIAVTA